jgi:hypothetical protein
MESFRLIHPAILREDGIYRDVLLTHRSEYIPKYQFRKCGAPETSDLYSSR